MNERFERERFEREPFEREMFGHHEVHQHLPHHQPDFSHLINGHNDDDDDAWSNFVAGIANLFNLFS